MFFYVLIDFFYIGVIILPFIFDKNPDIFREYFLIQEITIEFLFVILLKITIIFSVLYFFFQDKLIQKINIKGLILNFFLIIILFSLFFILSPYFITDKDSSTFIEEYTNELLFENILLLLLFYVLFSFIVISANYIYSKRNKKIIRKLANSEYEKEKLFKFILNYEEPIFDFYKYLRLLEFTNSYIVERKDQILSTINFIKIKDFGILFDFYYDDEIDGSLLLEFLKKNKILSEKYLILHINENRSKVFDLYKNFINIPKEIEEILWEELVNESLEIKEYSLKDFLLLLCESKNKVIFVNNTLQNNSLS